MTEPIKPVVGMGGTHQVGSDSYPYTIIEVSASGKTIKAQRDIAHRTVPIRMDGANPKPTNSSGIPKAKLRRSLFAITAIITKRAKRDITTHSTLAEEV